MCGLCVCVPACVRVCARVFVLWRWLGSMGWAFGVMGGGCGAAGDWLAGLRQSQPLSSMDHLSCNAAILMCSPSESTEYLLQAKEEENKGLRDRLAESEKEGQELRARVIGLEEAISQKDVQIAGYGREMATLQKELSELRKEGQANASQIARCSPSCCPPNTESSAAFWPMVVSTDSGSQFGDLGWLGGAGTWSVPTGPS